MKLISSALLLGLAPLANADCLSDYNAIPTAPTNPANPADYSDAYCTAVTATYTSCNGGSTSEQSLADVLAGITPMCDSTTCDYKYSTIVLCIADMGTTYTQAGLDACCGADSSLVTALNTACDGQTTLYGTEQGANFYSAAETTCNNGQAILDGAAGEGKVGKMAVAAAAAVAALIFS